MKMSKFIANPYLKFFKIDYMVKFRKNYLQGVRYYNSDDGMIPVDDKQSGVPPYEEKFGEPVHIKRSRLLYQSRKRGMSENGLLLSAFAHKFLNAMTEQELSQYDRLINLPSNDWDIYYWTTGLKEVPSEFDTEVMNKLKQFVKNEDKENRTRQPDLS